MRTLLVLMVVALNPFALLMWCVLLKKMVVLDMWPNSFIILDFFSLAALDSAKALYIIASLESS